MENKMEGLISVSELKLLAVEFDVIDGRPLFMNDSGFTWSKKAAESSWLNFNEIEVCREWLRFFCPPLKQVNHNLTSYHYKHAVEKWAATTGKEIKNISNGALIVAAYLEHYEVEPILYPEKKLSDPIN